MLPHIPVAGPEPVGPPSAFPGVFVSQGDVVLAEGSAPGVPDCVVPNIPVAGVLAGVAPNNPGVAAGVDPNKPVEGVPKPPLVFAGVEALPKPNMALSKHVCARCSVGRVFLHRCRFEASWISQVYPVLRLVDEGRVVPVERSDWILRGEMVVPAM